jgi:hypothetical protein
MKSRLRLSSTTASFIIASDRTGGRGAEAPLLHCLPASCGPAAALLVPQDAVFELGRHHFVSLKLFRFPTGDA